MDLTTHGLRSSEVRGIARSLPKPAVGDGDRKMTLMSRRRAIETALVLLALIAAVAPIPKVLVERWFSVGVYPRVQHVMTPLANLVPFAWFDVLLVAVISSSGASSCGPCARPAAIDSGHQSCRAPGRLS